MQLSLIQKVTKYDVGFFEGVSYILHSYIYFFYLKAQCFSYTVECFLGRHDNK